MYAAPYHPNVHPTMELRLHMVKIAGSFHNLVGVLLSPS